MNMSSYVNVVQRPDPTKRSFQVNYEVFGSGNHRVGFFLDKKFSQWVGTLESRLLNIPSVIEVGFDRYQILITISDASKWEQIEPQIIQEIGKAIDRGHPDKEEEP